MNPRSDSQPPGGSSGDPSAERIGKYTVTAALGEGPWGPQSRATEDGTGETVILRRVPRMVLHAGEEAVRGFLMEARAAAEVRHPALVPLLNVGRDAQSLYSACEDAAGEPLTAPLPIREALAACIAAADALGAVHKAGLTHRDVRPGNLLRAADGSIRLQGLGLVRIAEELQQFKLGLPLADPHHCSPELYQTGQVDGSCDVYSLGATLFELLAGRAPFVADTSMQVLHKHVSEPAPDVCELDPWVPPACSALIRRAMSKVPKERPTAAQFSAELRKLLAALPAVTAAVAALPVFAPPPASVKTPSTRSGAVKPALSGKWRSGPDATRASSKSITRPSLATDLPATSSGKWIPWAAAGAIIVVLGTASLLLTRNSDTPEPKKAKPKSDAEIPETVEPERPLAGTDIGPTPMPVDPTPEPVAIGNDEISEEYLRLTGVVYKLADNEDRKATRKALDELQAFAKKHADSKVERERQFAEQAESVVKSTMRDMDDDEPTRPDPKKGHVWLVFFAGFKDGSSTSNGVKLIVSAASPPGTPRKSIGQIFCKRNRWTTYAVNLSQFAGKKTELQFTVDPRDGNTGFDWFCWGEPQVAIVTAGGDAGTPVQTSVLDLVDHFPMAVKARKSGDNDLALGDGGTVQQFAGPADDRLLSVSGVKRRGVYMHPAWEHGHKEPVFYRWVMDVPAR